MVWYEIDNVWNVCVWYNESYEGVSEDLMCDFCVDNGRGVYENDDLVNDFCVDIERGVDGC